MPRIVTVTLIYHRHKPIDRKLLCCVCVLKRCGTFLLVNLIVAQVTNKFHTSNGTLNVISVFTGAHHSIVS
jgi:hypothetical protein